VVPNPLSGGEPPGPSTGRVAWQVGPDRIDVSLIGEIDMACRSRLDEVLAAVGDRVTCPVRVDLALVSFLASDGLSFIVRLRTLLSGSGAGVTLAGPPPQVLRVLRLSGVGHLFTIEP
jgi:anti-anti-sigma factor